MAPRLDAEDARQGKKGTPVLKVLIFGLILAVIAFIAVQIYNGTQPDNNIPSPSVGGDTSATVPATTGTSSTTTTTPGASTTTP